MEAAMATALSLLRARSRSRQEIRLALERRGHPAELIEQVVGRLGELGYLDEAAFARARASALLRGKLGPDAVRQRLLGHGLEPGMAEVALGEAQRELGIAPLESARALLAQRRLDPGALDARARARAARMLATRGFSEEVVEQLLGPAMVDSPPEEG